MPSLVTVQSAVPLAVGAPKHYKDHLFSWDTIYGSNYQPGNQDALIPYIFKTVWGPSHWPELNHTIYLAMIREVVLWYSACIWLWWVLVLLDTSTKPTTIVQLLEWKIEMPSTFNKFVSLPYLVWSVVLLHIWHQPSTLPALQLSAHYLRGRVSHSIGVLNKVW